MRLYRPALVLAGIAALLPLGAQQKVDTRSRLASGYAAIQAGEMRADLTFLSSDALEGRMSLARGSEVAMQWIASEFTKAGLKPVSGASFFQKVPLIEYRGDREASGLTLRIAGKSEILHFPDAYGSFPNDVTVAGPLVFAGYGITAPELGYDDYSGVDARGKIVLVIEHEPQEDDPHSIFNGSGSTRYGTGRMKILNAQKHGAVAVLGMSEPNRKHPSNQERIARIPGIERRITRNATQAIEADEASIPMFSLSDKVVARLFAAAGHKPGDLQAAIDKDLRPASMPIPGAEAELRVVNRERRRAESANVVGMLEGSDPTLRADTILFSAHYDHDGVAASGEIYHGANDNGSGTVGVIELARAYARNPIKPRRTLLFALWTAEERGLLGSYYYAQHPLRPLAATRAVLNFDMIGGNEAPSEQTKGLIEISADTTNELNVVGLKYSPDYRAAVEQANQSVGLKLTYKFDDNTALNMLFRSDQFPFLARGIPAMRWSTGFGPDYHQTTDTIEKINFPKLEKIVKLAYLTGWTFADEDQPPRFIPNPVGAPGNQVSSSRE